MTLARVLPNMLCSFMCVFCMVGFVLHLFRPSPPLNSAPALPIPTLVSHLFPAARKRYRCPHWHISMLRLHRRQDCCGCRRPNLPSRSHYAVLAAVAQAAVSEAPNTPRRSHQPRPGRTDTPLLAGTLLTAALAQQVRMYAAVEAALRTTTRAPLSSKPAAALS